MALSLRTRRAEDSREGLLITRIITALVLALLLLLGAFGTAHSESEGSSASSPWVTTSVDAHVTAGVEPDAATDPVGVFATAETGGVLVGAALCALGVLCGLALVIFVRRLLRHPAPAFRSRREAPRAPLAARIVTDRATALSLTQLGLSRT